MEKFFKDKSKLFECNLSVDGASIGETSARLVLQFEDNTNLLYYATLDENGKCKINIPPIKNMNATKGKAVLEVIAESTFFESWSGDFELVASKKVVVEMVTQEKSKPVIKKPQVTFSKDHIKEFSKSLSENNITQSNIVIKKNYIRPLLEKYISENSLSKHDVNHILSNLTQCANYLEA